MRSAISPFSQLCSGVRTIQTALARSYLRWAELPERLIDHDSHQLDLMLTALAGLCQDQRPCSLWRPTTSHTHAHAHTHTHTLIHILTHTHTHTHSLTRKSKASRCLGRSRVPGQARAPVHYAGTMCRCYANSWSPGKELAGVLTVPLTVSVSTL